MKELSIEEKAIAYDKALEIARQYWNDRAMPIGTNFKLERMFPELREPEDTDEKVRKALIKLVTNHASMDLFIEYDIHLDEALAWLEKQGEQKPWSEEDEMFVHGLIRGLAAMKNIHGHTTFSSDNIDITKTIDWLKSIKYRVQLQNLTVTDEELIKARNEAYDALDKLEYHSDTPTFNDGWSAAIWYLKKRNAQLQDTWKPSDEQMDALRYVTNFDYGGHKAILVSLYEQLKKL